MSFCTYSSDTHSGSFIVIENSFINEHLPLAPASCVKAYLYGLYLCSSPNSLENTMENMIHTLGMDAGELRDAFEYWQVEGLVQILENEDSGELDIKYLPVSRRSGSSKKRTNKYADFNSKIQSVLKSRMITPSEFNEYYTLLESFHMEEQALVYIAEYCVKLKGEKVGYPYIITVAKSFSNDGIKSADAVREKLSEHEEVASEMNTVIKALGRKGISTIEERNLFIKWTNEFGFGLGVIKEVAALVKAGGIPKLDATLTKYYNLKLASMKEIIDYEEKREQYFSLAREISRTLGLYYQNLDTIVENYIVDWLQKGYNEQTLKKLSHYCLRRSIRTMEGMNTTIQKFYKLGLVTDESIDQYISSLVSTDGQIQEVLNKCNILRSVNTWDRDSYRTWTEVWGLSQEIILFVAEFASGKAQPIQYLNKVLSGLFESKINTIEKAKKYMEGFTSNVQPSTYKGYEERTYNQKDLDALFDNLDNIEI